jgi:glycosyltransferase involved in cell wall biosynthesis
MKILVVNNMVPFLRGGAEELADNLVGQLCLRGIEAELLRVPFKYHPAECIYNEMLLCRMLQLYGVDRVIALKFPAYLIPHHNKVLWLMHQYRQAYDLWGTVHSNIPPGQDGEMLRVAIEKSDNECFGGCQAIYVNSEITRNRLKVFNGFESEILYPPVNDPELFVNEGYGDYVFCGGRINNMKRQSMLVEAMKQVRCPGKLLIAGPSDSPSDERVIREMIEHYGLKDRVRLEVGFHSRLNVATWLRNALASAYIPVEEDSYGYCAMEAFQSSKAVLTTTDSGGVARLVTNDKTGWIAEPTLSGLVEALERVFSNRDATCAMGAAAADDWAKRNINWDYTIQRLMS